MDKTASNQEILDAPIVANPSPVYTSQPDLLRQQKNTINAVGNSAGTINIDKILLKMKNISGQTINQGNVVVYGSTSLSEGTVKLLVIAGGGQGGGGNNTEKAGGAGGAGEYYYNAAYVASAQAYTVTVGAGGTGSSQQGNSGGNSVFNTITSLGGGGGGYSNTLPNGVAGGSGGGGSERVPGNGAASTHVMGLGNAGANGSAASGFGGGGGGSAAAGSGQTGGTGTANSISGASVTYTVGGQGGGAGAGTGTTAAGAGSGGGGANRDGGATNGANGRDGVVVIRYVTADFGACTGGTITTDGADTVHTFTTSGTFTLVGLPTVEATGNEITTTTTVGDDKVAGIAYEQILDQQYGSILFEGITVNLTVDGTTDIAIGDFLSTYSTAGIAAKASSGDMIFALAREAYTGNDSNGVIEALLIGPRKI